MRRTLLLITLLLSVAASVAAQSESRTILRIDGDYYYVDTLRTDRTLSDLARIYDIAEEEIMSDNTPFGIEVDRPLRIRCNRRMSSLAPRRADENNFRYRVRNGDSAFSVAITNALSFDVIAEDNPGIDLTDISNLRYLNIRVDRTGLTQVAELAAQSHRYAAILNRLSAENEYVVVEAGQTLYSLARENELTVDKLNTLNGSPAVLGAGMLIKLPRRTPLPTPTAFDPATLIDVDTVDTTYTDVFQFGEVEPFDGGVLDVALLLPLTDSDGAVRGSFVEFFNGALLAAEELKAEGHSVRLNLFDTHNDTATVDSLVRGGALETADLIIGPVYERNMQPAAAYAASRGKIMVSPLASVEASWGMNFYQMSPAPADKYAKMRELVTPETNVIYIYTSAIDSELEHEMNVLLDGHPVSNVVFDYEFKVDTLIGPTIEDVMSRDDNLFVVLSDTELEVDRTLAIISSIMNSRQPRYPTRRVPIRVVGSSKWTRYRNLDKNLLFKLDVSYAANYHADRGNETVRAFDRRYADDFGRIPSLYAYRAYDALKLFGSALYGTEGSLAERLNAADAPLQTHYEFDWVDGAWRNTEWAVVNYAHTYNIITR